MAFVLTVLAAFVSLALIRHATSSQHVLAGPDYGTPLPGQKIAGDSPFKHCAADFSNDILNVTNIALEPKEPKAFSPITFLLNGTLSTSLSLNATVLLSYYIYDDPDDDILYTIGPICEILQETIEQNCPPQIGELGIFWTLEELPWFYMPGDVLFWHLEAWTEERERITCLEGMVEIVAPGEG